MLDTTPWLLQRSLVGRELQRLSGSDQTARRVPRGCPIPQPLTHRAITAVAQSDGPTLVAADLDFPGVNGPGLQVLSGRMGHQVLLGDTLPCDQMGGV